MIGLISFLGLIMGVFLGRFTKEEIVDGRKYFILFRYSLLILIIGLGLYSFFQFSTLLWILAGYILFFLASNLYLYFGLMLVSILDENISLLILVIVFLFGLVEGSLLGKGKNRFIMVSFIFFVIPLVGSFFPVDLMLNVFNGLAVGGLIHGIWRYHKRDKKKERA